MKVMKV